MWSINVWLILLRFSSDEPQICLSIITHLRRVISRIVHFHLFKSVNLWYLKMFFVSFRLHPILPASPSPPAVEIARAQFLCFPETWQTCSASFRRSEESLVRKGKPWVQAYPSHVSCSWLIKLISFSKVHFPMSWDSPRPCAEDPSLPLCSGSLTPAVRGGRDVGRALH